MAQHFVSETCASREEPFNHFFSRDRYRVTTWNPTLEKPAQGEQADTAWRCCARAGIRWPRRFAEPVEACRELVAEPTAADADGFLASFYRSQQG